jgi:hypothetical protein
MARTKTKVAEIVTPHQSMAIEALGIYDSISEPEKAQNNFLAIARKFKTDDKTDFSSMFLELARLVVRNSEHFNAESFQSINSNNFNIPFPLLNQYFDIWTDELTKRNLLESVAGLEGNLFYCLGDVFRFGQK